MRRLFEGGVYLRAASISGNTEYRLARTAQIKAITR